MSILNKKIVNRNYIENEALVSTVDFRVQSAVSWEMSIVPWHAILLHKVNRKVKRMS